MDGKPTRRKGERNVGKGRAAIGPSWMLGKQWGRLSGREDRRGPLTRAPRRTNSPSGPPEVAEIRLERRYHWFALSENGFREWPWRNLFGVVSPWNPSLYYINGALPRARLRI